MTKKIFIRRIITVTLSGMILFALLYQEYKPVTCEQLSTEKIRLNNLVADFIYPLNQLSLPTVIFLPGSAGGIANETDLKSLALHGYAVLSLAYFKEPGLPDKLENIPLEYFENAFTWLKTKPQIDTSKLLLVGVSRGAELALLLGSLYKQVKGVIAYSPSCFILPNATEVDKDTLVASWTLGGKPIPFATIDRLKESQGEAIQYRTYFEPLLASSDPQEEFTIKVERINGPILLISGASDAVWPASEMAVRIEERLERRGFKHKIINTVFPNGGHDVFMFKNCIPIISSIVFRRIRLTIRGQQYEFNLGGTTLGTIESKMKSREIALQFLESFKNTDSR